VSLHHDPADSGNFRIRPDGRRGAPSATLRILFMKMKSHFRRILLVTTLAVVGMCALSPRGRNVVIRFWPTLGLSAPEVSAAATPDAPGAPPPDMNFPPPGFGGPSPFGTGGFGPGPMRETKLVVQFDKDGKGWLNIGERKAAREYLREHPTGRPGMRRGPRGGRPSWAQRDDEAPPSPGPKISPADVESLAGVPLYTSNVVRTLFLDFDDTDWELEMAEFKNTDVEVPARLTVDGRIYPDVGVHFHGMSSFMMMSAGH